MRAVAAHRRGWRTRCGVDVTRSLAVGEAGQVLGALGPIRAVGALRQLCRIALGVLVGWVGYLVLVTFWGAVLELLSHLQQASP